MSVFEELLGHSCGADSSKTVTMGAHSQVKDSGQARLEALGYKQVLKRDLSVVSNFAFSFSIISILTGISTLYTTGLRYGGPISMVYGWLIAGFFNGLVGLSMAEICSAYPTSGGLYYWSSELAGKSWGPFASWITGWFNVVALWAGMTSVEFSLASMLQSLILLATGGGNGGGYLASKYVVLGMHGGLLFSHALVNSASITLLSYLGQLASAWNVVGSIVLMLLIPLVSTERQSAEFVFKAFNTEPGVGIHSTPYIFLLGMLICPYSLAGYDASAHLTEETKASDKNAAYGILSAIGMSTVFGWAFLLGIAFATANPDYVLDPANDAGGYAIAQVFYSAFYSRYGSGVGGIICLGVVALGVWFACMAILTSTSRMAFAFARDGAMPFSRVWRMVDKRDVPLNSVWLCAIIPFIMALTSLKSVVAFQAMVSIATASIYIAYALPTLFRVTVGRNTFVPGPFHMKKHVSLVVGWIAVLWVATLTVLLCLPVAYPVDSQTLNYAPVAIGGLFLLVTGWWLLSARKWFKGPVGSLSVAEKEVLKISKDEEQFVT